MNNWHGKQVFVTGAGGFVGANLTRSLLSLGCNVSVLVRPTTNLWRLADVANQLTFHKGDLLDDDFVRASIVQSCPEILYHVAFPGGHVSEEKKRIDMLSTGVLGTNYLLHAARENGVERFIQIGSSTEYGHRNTAHKESDPIDPISVRGVSKSVSTLLCRQFAHEFNYPVHILRLYAVYGPWEQPKRLIPRLCRAVLTREPISLTPPGIVHDWIYVDDVVEACIKTAESDLPPGEILNIASGEETTNEEIFNLVEKVSKRKIALSGEVYAPRKFDTSKWRANISKAKEMLGWQPSTSLQEGIAASFHFWNKTLRQISGY